MANVRHKHPDQLTNRRGGRGRGLVVPLDPNAERRVVTMPRGLLPEAQRVWREFWRSRPSYAVDANADRGRLLHWIRSVNERERLWPLLEAAPVIKGATGMLVPNPLVRRIRELTRDIERAEEAFGMTPLSRFRLQIEYAEAGRATLKLARDERREQPKAAREPEIVDYDA